ncbi:MAG: S-layer homology domain-containing protein, partial [Oscillospiraceae bacterium]
YVTRDLDMTGFTWIPIGTTRTFVGVFEGKGVRTITGINYSDNSNNTFGLFGTVSGTGIPHAIPNDHDGNGSGQTALNSRYTGTAIYNLAVDGSKTTDKIWNSSTAHHMGGIAAKAKDATIQNCAVRNLSLTILNTPHYSVHVGGIVGETLGDKCKLLNNSVGQSGAAMTLTADTGATDRNAFAGGIVGKATGTAISGNIVGGNNGHKVTINAVPQNGTEQIYAGGVVGYMDGGSIANETWAHLNAMTVSATTFTAASEAYAGGVAGYLKDATMTGCTPGANDGETHSITAKVYPDGVAGKHYAGGLVGGMSGTSKITNCTIGSDAPANYKVTSGAGAESFAGGLVGDATNARIYQCSAESIGVHGGNSGGLAGRFTATSKAADNADNAAGVMARCYARNCSVTSATGTGQYCGMMQTVNNAYILGCYATAATPGFNGFYAVANATNSNFVGCYSTVSTAPAMSAGGSNTTFENCYVLNPNSSASAALDDAAIVGLTADKMTSGRNDTALIAALNDGLNGANKTNFDKLTGNLRMSYMSGNSKEINGNYNYPIYAVWLLTVNSLPSSVYGTYTVTADGKTIATNATGFNQYWVAKDAKITITGTPDSYYATADAATFTITNAAGTGTDSGAITAVAMNRDKTATVTFTQRFFPGWTINGTHSNATPIYSDASIQNGTLDVVTDNKLAGNTVKDWNRNISGDWNTWHDARTIKTIFVTAATTTDGASNPIISAFTADGWQVATGGAGQAYIQLTNAQGADAAAVSAIVNSIEFAASKTSTGDVTVDVQVYVDENVRGSMYFFGGSIYELAGSAVGQPAAKALAENSTLGAKKGHLVVIGSYAEHKFLKDNVKTNAWTAAVTSAPGANVVSTWTWGGVSATSDETSYLQSQSSWAGGEPNNSGTYATYNYGGKFDDTNGANVALIEYDALSGASTAWQAYSALASGTVTCHVVMAPPVYPTPGPEPEKPDPNVTVEPGPGKVTTFPQNPDPGTKVTVTIEPETGWKIDKVIIVTVPGGDPVVVTGTNPVTYIAPDPNTVKITVKYIRIPTDPKITGVSKLLETDKHIAYMKGDDMGNFNPEKGITRAETAQMFYNLLRNKDIGEVAKFSDVEAGAWYADAVNALAELKIISGRSADKFAPKDYISRAEFTAIAMRFAASVKGEKTFTDVPADYWAESYIAGAAQYGWINGYDDGTFNPLGNIKRCEATKIVNAMLWRFADTAYVDSAKDLKLFPDVSVKNWAFYDIVEATNPHDFKHDKPGVETWAK